MMNTIYPNEGAQLHVIGAEAKPGTNMEGLLLSNLGVFFLQVARLLPAELSSRKSNSDLELLSLLKIKFRVNKWTDNQHGTPYFL